jgi:hypothetical protein
MLIGQNHKQTDLKVHVCLLWNVSLAIALY